MKINFTKKEYRTLVKMIYLANWMMASHSEANEKISGDADALQQKIYSLAKDMDCLDLIESNKELNGFYETIDLEEDSFIRSNIDEYDSHTFWHGLVDRLAERDVCESEGISSVFDLDIEKRIELMSSAEEKWSSEFEVYDLSRLRVAVVH